MIVQYTVRFLQHDLQNSRVRVWKFVLVKTSLKLFVIAERFLIKKSEGKQNPDSLELRGKK